MTQTVQPGSHVGRVTALDGGFALIEFVRSQACGDCHACLYLGDNRMQTRVKNTLKAEVGDLVSVMILPKKIVNATLLAYGVPLLMLLGGLYLGSLISEIASAVLGLGLCGISYLILHRLEKRFQASETYQPKMVRIVSETEEKTHE